jgi:hypothetical protein
MFREDDLVHRYARADGLGDGVSPGTAGRLTRGGWRGKGRRSSGAGAPPRTSSLAPR